MNHCKNCDWWGDEAGEVVCRNNSKIGEAFHVLGDGEPLIDQLCYPYDEGVEFIQTGPEFGCVHFIAKDKP